MTAFPNRLEQEVSATLAAGRPKLGAVVKAVNRKRTMEAKSAMRIRVWRGERAQAAMEGKQP